jgi:hypothetical protein
MSRVTSAQLDQMAASVSELLPSGLAVQVERHSGRSHVALYRTEGDSSGQVRIMRAGTGREMYEWLLAMREALLLSKEGHR